MVKGNKIACSLLGAVLFPSLLTGQSFVLDQPFVAAIVAVYYSRAVEDVLAE